MVFLEAFKKFCVNACNVVRIDKSRRCACFFFNKLCSLFAHSIEWTECDYGNLTALLSNFIFIKFWKILCARLACWNQFCNRNTNCNRVICLLNTPVEDCKVIFLSCRSDINKVRNVWNHGNIKNSEVCNICHTVYRRSLNKDCCRVWVNAQVLWKLIVGSLYEWAVNIEYGLAAVLCDSRCHCNSCLFCDTYIKELSAECFSLIRSKAVKCGSAGCNRHNRLVRLHLISKIICCNWAVVLLIREINSSFACFNIKRHTPMPAFFVSFSRLITFTFKSVNMNDNRMINVFYRLKSLDKLFNIVAVLDIYIIKPHWLEKITFSLAVCVTKKFEIFIKSAVIFCNRHLVIICNNNQVWIHFTGNIKTFKSLTAADWAVTDECNNIALAVCYISAPCKSAGKANRGWCMTDSKNIVFALYGACIACYIIVMLLRNICLFSACEDFMRIWLVWNIKHKLVLWWIKYIMKGNCSLYNTEIRAEVTAVNTCTVK